MNDGFEIDREYYREWLRLSRKGRVRLVNASPEAVVEEIRKGNNCYLVIVEPETTDEGRI